MVTVAETLALGTRHYEAGRLADAEKAFRQALAVDPQNSFALHQLGALAMDARRFDRAVEFLEKAVRAEPSRAAYHANLGLCYRHLGNAAQAERSLRAAVELEPGLVQVHAALGALLHAAGRLAEAADCYRRVVQAEPGSPDAHFDLGSVLQNLGDIEQAARCYEQALKLEPNHALSHVNLGIICKQQGSLDEAIVHFHKALEIEPQNSAALANLGSAYETAGQTDEAMRAYRAALAADSASTTARNNLGALLQKLDRLDEARDCFQKVLDADPRFVGAYLGFASIHYRQRNLAQALASCAQALEVDPRSAKAYLSMGIMLNEQGRRDEAVSHLRRAIELDPLLPSAHGNLAIALDLTGHVDESLAHHRREIEINPRSSLQHSNLLYGLNFHPDLDAQTIFDEHRAWAQKHADPLTAASAPHANDGAGGRRLRVGYVSPHFFGHAVNFFTEPILASHDHQAFEIFCYSDVVVEDETTNRLRGYADCFRKILGQGHEQVSRQIREDKIDVLVDLTGHIGENRMLVFARKPAPVQVTYIGYQNTTGMRAIAYRLTDDYADPPGLTDRYYTERLVRLPTTFFCYRPSADAPEVGPLGALDRGYVTFGSFNNFAKVTPCVLKTWAEILLSVRGSRLVVLADMVDSLARYLRETFAAQGVDQKRLELVNRLPRSDYLRLIARVDVALDPFPFNGHTTTCDCLWQGVPVVTLSGRSYASRFGGSGLATLGLDDLIAGTPERYKEIAVELAGDLERLGQLRSTLRARMARSPLLDFQTFTRNLEAEYRRMWRLWWEEKAEG
ncbi:MAG: tetratricopeptide repeat protein [Pirellulales bacterium]